jgi:hypothetical protein
LSVAETAFFDELAMAGFRQERGHVAAVCDIGNLGRVSLGIRVGKQRKWSGTLRTMAGGAIAVEDRRDVAVERDGCACLRSARCKEQKTKRAETANASMIIDL